MNTSKIGQLNWKDMLKGAYLAGIAALVTAILQVLQAGPIEWTWVFWIPTFTTTAIAFLSYLVKNLTTNSDDTILRGEGNGGPN